MKRNFFLLLDKKKGKSYDSTRGKKHMVQSHVYEEITNIHPPFFKRKKVTPLSDERIEFQKN